MKIQCFILSSLLVCFFACKKNQDNNQTKKPASDTTRTNNPKDTVVTNNPKDTTVVSPADSAKLFKASMMIKADSVGGNVYVVIEKPTREVSTFKVIFNHAETQPEQIIGPGVIAYGFKVPQGAVTGPVYVSMNNHSVKVLDTFYVVKTKFEWKKLKPFPGGKRQHGVAFAVNNKAYFGTGENPETSQYFGDMWQYQEHNDTWIKKSGLPYEAGRTNSVKTSAFSFVYKNRAFVGGGYPSNGNHWAGEIVEYNAVADTWTMRVSSGWKEGFGASSAVILNDVVYIHGHYPFEVAYIYYVNDNIVGRLYNWPGYRYYGAINNMIIAGDNGHISTLYGSNGTREELNHPLVAPPFDAGVFKVAVPYRGELYMSFGDQGYLWKFNFTTKKWKVVAHQQMNISYGVTTVLLGNKLYAVGGSLDVRSGATDDVWVIDLDPYVR